MRFNTENLNDKSEKSKEQSKVTTDCLNPFSINGNESSVMVGIMKSIMKNETYHNTEEVEVK